MTTDLSVTVEAEEPIAEDTLRDAFQSMGDGAYHDDIVDVNIVGQTDSPVAPCHIGIELTSRKGGKLSGMRMETAMFLRRELRSHGVSVTRLDVEKVPPHQVIQDALEMSHE